MFREATVSLRPEVPEDRDFLLDLYLSTRDDEAGYRDLDPGERTQWLAQQFDWQHRQYREAFPGAWFTIVLVDEKPAGRLYVVQLPSAFHVVDISLLPEYRGHGIGSQLIKNIQAEATRLQLPVQLQVVEGSEARGFYDRLGFRMVLNASNVPRQLLEWHPPKPPGSA